MGLFEDIQAHTGETRSMTTLEAIALKGFKHELPNLIRVHDNGPQGPEDIQLIQMSLKWVMSCVLRNERPKPEKSDHLN